MGGHARGADASRLALEAFAIAIASGAPLGDAVERADLAVRALVNDGWSYDAPETTLVAARLAGVAIHGVWSGDSRAYRLRTDGVFELLTEDHAGVMGGLEHALGAFSPSPDPVHVDEFEVATETTAGLLLCTDGLNGPFDEAWITGLVGEGVRLVDYDPYKTLGVLLGERGLHGLVELAATVGSDNVAALWWPLGASPSQPLVGG